ncbi:hypothetical protein ONS95_013692 [Cadophora gregata]|uniref:uncharacterized protein n=1 Tax=Cadophora gregata TaxID=51156 RepID=UPI0026DD8BBC|nr:uncharacterized protein ONS95_013692 [Cadophora gregata]KAK0113434.1 hypothetical protein ONS96_014300 [Cadophora gregata f. sp. sojae]KAK0114192.1 hypothetical protein ONS95_013692 [Cadophora gregata]
MTSTHDAHPDSSRSQDDSALDRRTNSSTFSASNRFSIGSSETGESSRAASKRSSLRTSDSIKDLPNGDAGTPDAEKPVKDGRGSHRSHRSRRSGGFLLSNAAFEPPADTATSTGSAVESLLRQRHSLGDQKGKTTLKSPERRHRKRRSNIGTSVGGSPLASNVVTASTGNGTADINAKSREDGVESMDHEPTAKPTAAAPALDVDSAQIVNLALNLSESRRNAQRRVISTSMPPATGGLGESFTGSSLRHQLQQQRRVSRNVSPKPDRGERTTASSPRLASGQRINSPLQASFDTQPDGQYQYHFSASTLARAEKAKNAIELMAQYRRLLQYVPPLKPQALDKTFTASPAGTAPGSPIISSSKGPSRTISNTSSNRPLGRPYNPLQYIRNRKVRSRNSRAIDGEAQGFGDLEKVSSWVDAVSHQASSEDGQADCLMMPQFSKAADDAASPFGSPQSGQGKPQSVPVKVKRPRIDWVTNPADMIADVFWLEQDDNKKLIEDRHGLNIFPASKELKRPISRSDEPEVKNISPKAKADDLGLDMRMLDTKLPEFKSVKPDSERFPDLSTSRARKKFRDVRAAARLHHGHSGSLRHLRSSRSRSDDSDSDESDDSMPKRRKRRSGTTDSYDNGRGVLEKQMMEILAKEAEEARWSSRDNSSKRHDGTPMKPLPKDMARANGSAGHSRSASLVKDSRANGGSSGRASLEVPGINGRGSMEDLNTTAPNSPSMKATKLGDRFVPSIAMDLSSGRSRPTSTSPSRRPLSRMRSKIRPYYERSQESEHQDENVAVSVEQDQESPDPRRRSISPVKKIISRNTDDSQKAFRKSGSIRKGKEDSGIRGLFKNARNPVSRVSDLLWRKEASPGQGNSSGFSTDESDMEEIRNPQQITHSRDSSVGTAFDDAEDASPQIEKKSYINSVPPLPTFTSPFERRGRPTRMQSDESYIAPNSRSQKLPTREERRKFGSDNMLDAPRIDVHNASPTSSPDAVPINRFQRDSSVSDIDSRRNSINGVKRADARLNSILGLPGKRRNALPITGLSSLETSHDHRPSLGGRQWSISDRSPSEHRGPLNRREIARVRALLLSSGIKAKEISRRAAELKDLRAEKDPLYGDIADMAHEEIEVVPKSQQHRLAARIISDDVQLSSQIWQDSADTFVNDTVNVLMSRIGSLQHRLVDNLTPMTRTAADEADEVSKDLVTSQMLKVKMIGDKIDKMTRTRRRRFRWLRRGGWVLVEWALVGIMWYVWFVVVIARVFMGIGKGVVGSLRWLLWL